MTRLRQLTIWWPLAGAALGALGDFAALMTLGAIINGVEVSRGWIVAVTVLCPTLLFSHGFWWWPLLLNCLIYALVVAALRLAWLRWRG